MRRITLRSREEARRDVEREQYHPSYPPGLLYSAYPKRGPNGLLAMTIQLGVEGGVSLATVVCGDHIWTEATCPGLRRG
jgi:hypothetical protein